MEVDDEFTKRLKAVFDLCDTEHKGFISVDYFVDLAKEHFGSGDWNSSQEAIAEIVSILDSDGSGKINFHDFCKGVRHIQGPVTPSVSVDGMKTFSYPAAVPEAMFGSVKVDANSFRKRNGISSDVNTYNGYDVNEDCLPQLSDGLLCLRSGSSEDDVDSGFSNKSNDHFDHNDRWSESTEKEEALGYECEDIGQDFSFPYGQMKLISNPNSKYGTPVSYGSQPGSVKRLTPSAIASQLYRGNSSLNTSRRSSISDGLYDDMDSSFVEMSDKIKRLEDQIRDLSDTQTRNDDKHLRMKEENSTLVERVHTLEEQLREIEQRAQERLVDEQKKHREVLFKTDKDKSREIEILSQSLQHIEREYLLLREEVPLLRSENDRLRRENAQLERETSHLHQQLSELSDEHKALQEHVHAEQIKTTQEHKVHTQLIDELSKELDELRQLRAEALLRSSPTVSADLPRSLRREMESQIIRLKQDNMNLRDQAEDLHAQLINRHVQEGRSLLQQTETSLATEFEKLPRDELMKALQKEQESNSKLREYVELITLRILEKNPSILEVSSKRK